jgi:hypothetical protein
MRARRPVFDPTHVQIRGPEIDLLRAEVAQLDGSEPWRWATKIMVASRASAGEGQDPAARREAETGAGMPLMICYRKES